MIRAARAALWGGLGFLVTLAGAGALLQVLLAAAPGDPIAMVPGGEELRPALAAEWGLDQPLPVRILRAVSQTLRGDLGVSLTVRPGAAVSGLVLEAAGRSLALLLPSLLLAVGTALALAALRGRYVGKVRRLVAMASALPVFLLAWAAVTGLNAGAWALMERELIARPGWFALPDQDSALRAALAMVALAWGSGTLSELHASFEEEIGRVREAGFVAAARGLGLPVWPHVVRNLAPVVAALTAARVGALLGGLVIVEKVLMLRGAGALLWEAALQRDYPLAFGLGLAAAATAAGARLLGDVVVAALDPRPRRSEA